MVLNLNNMNKLFSIIKFIFYTTILFFVLNSYSYASGTLILTPENPGPYEEVTINYKNYSFDIDNADYTWSINNKPVLSGKGEKILKTKTGDIGSVLNISVKITSPEGEETTLLLNLLPQTVDLTWETTESHVPPFYEGRSLPGENSEVRVIANPIFSEDGKLIKPSEISYAWYINDKFNSASSGRGRQVLKTRLDYLSNENIIKVIARSEKGSIAEKRITIYPNEIVPIFYSKDPIYGLDLAHGIKKRFETTKDFTLEVVPYFLSNKNNLAREITYAWSLDGIPFETEENTVVAFAPKKDSYGVKNLSISIKNPKRMLQSVEGQLEIIFDTR